MNSTKESKGWGLCLCSVLNDKEAVGGNNNGYRLAPLCARCLRNSPVQQIWAQASILFRQAHQTFIINISNTHFHLLHHLFGGFGGWGGGARKGPFFVFFLSLHGKNHSRKPQDPQKNKTQGSGVLKGANISLPREKKRKERERKSFNRERHVR